MATSMQQAGKPRRNSFLAGLLLGCAITSILGICLIGSAVVLIAQASTYSNNNWINSPSSSPVESGERVFQNRCAFCHSTGTNTVVGPGMAGLFSPGGPILPNGVDYDGKLPNGKDINDANIAEWIREGGSGEIGHMPGIPLNDQQMEDLITFLKTLE